MAQETELWEKETNLEREMTHERLPQESETGTNRPAGDGDVGDEQVNRIGRDDSGRPIGQDHSTERHESQEPVAGVGAVQNSNIVGTDIADLPDNG